MVSSLLKNGVEFCHVFDDRTVVHGDKRGTFTVLTSRRVETGPGDVFEIVGREVRYNVRILNSQVGNDGWATLCELT